MRSSSFSQSLMARKAMREELVSRSHTLNAASRAIRHAFNARRARSSTPPAFAAAETLAADPLLERGRELDSSWCSSRCGGDLRDIDSTEPILQCSRQL